MDKLKEITIEYNKNGKTCEEIALEYRNYPELIYLLPTLKEEFFQTKEGEKVILQPGNTCCASRSWSAHVERNQR